MIYILRYGPRSISKSFTNDKCMKFCLLFLSILPKNFTLSMQLNT